MDSEWLLEEPGRLLSPPSVCGVDALFRTLAVAVTAAAVLAGVLLFVLRRRPYGRRAAKEDRRVCCAGSGEAVRVEFEGVAGERPTASDVAVVGRGGG